MLAQQRPTQALPHQCRRPGAARVGSTTRSSRRQHVQPRPSWQHQHACTTSSSQLAAVGRATTTTTSCAPEPAHRTTSSSSSGGGDGWRRACSAALVAVLTATQLAAAAPSWALLSSPNARIPRSPEAALRRSIPAFNADVAAMQKKLEDVQFLLRIPQRKPWGNMAGDVGAALAAFDDRSALLAGVPADHQQAAQELLDSLFARLKQLELAVKTQQADFVDVRVADCLRQLSDLELLQAPGLPFSLPREYAGLPRLVGRAKVELAFEKADDSLAFIDRVNGGLSKRGKVVLTLDGYSAPISAGNFVVNVLDGLYDNKVVSASYASVIIGGDPIKARPPIPLEILPAGTFDPLYRLPLDVQGGELPVLPLSIAGAVSMARLPEGGEAFLSGDQFFVFKFSKEQAGLSGLSFDEGTFGVFAYVTEGLDVVGKLASGDVLRSAKLVAGRERLVLPAAPAVAAAAAQ